MTPAEFQKRMQEICAGTDTRSVKREAMLLVTRELGEGMPAYLPALELLAARLHTGGHRGDTSHIGGTDGATL